MKLKFKIKTFESTIIPVLTYGSQTWETTEYQMKKPQVTQNSMLRNILGVRIEDKLSLEKIYSKTKAKRVSCVAFSRKYPKKNIA